MSASNNTIVLGLVSIVAASSSCVEAWSSVTEYTDWEQWQAAAGDYTTIDFTDQSPGTIITEQYAALGATFTDGDDNAFTTSSFTQDGYGLRGSIDLSGDDQIAVLFDAPRYWVGVHYPGVLQVELYHQDQLFFTSTDVLGSGFIGLVSTQPFDRIRMFGPFGFSNIDNLYFGGVPAPPGLALLALGAMTRCRRRQ